MKTTKFKTHLNVAHSVPLLVDMLTVGDHLLYLSALKKIQLQQLGHVLTEVDAVKHTQQLPAHCDRTRTESNRDNKEYTSEMIRLKRTKPSNKSLRTVLMLMFR